MEKKPYVSLQPTESTIVQAAATIYAGYLASGRVSDGGETEWIKQSIKDAIRMARWTDDAVQADTEVG